MYALDNKLIDELTDESQITFDPSHHSNKVKSQPVFADQTWTKTGWQFTVYILPAYRLSRLKEMVPVKRGCRALKEMALSKRQNQ